MYIYIYIYKLIMYVVHLCSAMCITSEALFDNNLYSAPSQLLPSPSYAGTQPIRPSRTPLGNLTNEWKNERTNERTNEWMNELLRSDSTIL